MYLRLYDQQYCLAKFPIHRLLVFTMWRKISVHGLSRVSGKSRVGGEKYQGVAVAPSVASYPMDKSTIYLGNAVMRVHNTDLIWNTALHTQLTTIVKIAKTNRILVGYV